MDESLLSSLLKPIINQEAVQAIILGNLKVYEPLLKGNIEQASELKTELIKLYGNTQNDEPQAFSPAAHLFCKIFA